MAGNSQAHQIRLAGPWQLESGSEINERVKLPFIGQQSNESMVVRRAFNGSEGILAAKQIRIRIAYQGTPPQVQLNQQPLTSKLDGAATNHLEFDVTAIVAKTNSLVLTCGKQAADQVKDACLLIFEAE